MRFVHTEFWDHRPFGTQTLAVLLGAVLGLLPVSGRSDGADIKARKINYHAFSVAEQGDLKQVKALLQKDPDLIRHTSLTGWTLMHYAALGGQPEVVKYLAEQGGDVHARDKFGDTPLHRAAHAPDRALETAKVLVSLGADPKAYTTLPGGQPGDIGTHSVLDVAAGCGHWRLVKYLLENGATVRERTPDGKPRASALHEACRNSLVPKYVRNQDPETVSNWKVIELLIEHGADINARNWRQQTPLHVAATARATATVRYLLTCPRLDVDVQDDEGNTPLHAAIDAAARVMNHSSDKVEYALEIVKALLEEGARTDLRNKNFLTPLDLARQKGVAEAVKILEEHSRKSKE